MSSASEVCTYLTGCGYGLTDAVIVFCVLSAGLWIALHVANEVNNPDSSIDLLSVGITIVVLLAVVATGAEVVNSYEEGIEPNGEFGEAAEAYCEQELGEEAELFMANVMGSHGGYHCDGPDGEIIHLHDVPDEEIYAALPE